MAAGSGSAQAPRRIGATSATSAIRAGSLAAAKTDFRPRREPLLGQRHDRDHALVGFARAVAEAEDAVLQQHQPLDGRTGLVNLGRLLGQQKARHDVGHDPDKRPVQIGDALGGVGLVGEAQHRGRMRVVDEFVRQKRVQQRLDRGVRRAGVEQIGALDAHHVLVGQRVAAAQLAQRREADRRQARRLDIAHVPAAALDAQHLGRLAEQVGHHGLDRGVAAAVQHQPRLAAEQPRGIDAQRQIGCDAALAVARDDRLGIAIRPQAAHRSSSGMLPAGAYSMPGIRSARRDA